MDHRPRKVDTSSNSDRARLRHGEAMSTVELTPGQQAILDGFLSGENPATPTATATPGAVTRDITDLNDRDLARLITMLLAEQQERAVRNSDPEALIADGYDRLFTSRGEALEPEIVAGVLVCAGSLKALSASSHECSFVHVDDAWCWEHPDALEDDVRKLQVNGRDNQRSITLIPATEGAKIDFVTCKMTPREGHKVKKSTSYTITDGKLEVTNTRTAPRPGAGK